MSETNRYSAIIRSFLFASLILCSLGLLGWLINFQFLRSPIAGFAPIRPITAVAFIGISIVSLWRSFAPRSTLAPVALQIVGGAVAALGAYVVGSYILDYSTITDNFMIPAGYLITDVAGNRTPPQTALSFVFLGLAVLFVGRHGRTGQIVGGFATLTALAVTYAVILGMLFNASETYDTSNRNTMAVIAAISFVLTGAAFLAMNAECRLFTLFTSSDLGGQTARRLLPVIIIVPTCVGWLRVVGQEMGFYETAAGTAMSTFVLVLLMCAIVVVYSLKVSKADRERLAVEEELVRNEEKYRDLFDYSQGMICIHGIDGVLQAVNPAVVAATAYSANELVGRNITEFLSSEGQSFIGGYFRQIEFEGLSSGLLPIIAKDGRQLTWRYQSILVANEDCEPYVIGHAVDVTELIAAQRQLREMSLTDEMTGILNRRGFLTLAEQQLRLERHNATARGLTLMFADMDGLKKINDSLGHEAGSEAISMLARIVKSVVRSGDLVARWGGDEFVILSIGAGDENIRLMSDRIQEGLAEYNARSGKPYKVACSIGVAPVRLDGSRTFEDIIAEADEAMYEEKKHRKAARSETPMIVPASDPGLMHDSLAWY